MIKIPSSPENKYEQELSDIKFEYKKAQRQRSSEAAYILDSLKKVTQLKQRLEKIKKETIDAKRSYAVKADSINEKAINEEQRIRKIIEEGKDEIPEETTVFFNCTNFLVKNNSQENVTQEAAVEIEVYRGDSSKPIALEVIFDATTFPDIRAIDIKEEDFEELRPLIPSWQFKMTIDAIDKAYNHDSMWID